MFVIAGRKHGTQSFVAPRLILYIVYNSNAVQDRLHDITEGLNFVRNESDIDSNLNCFYHIIDDVCSPTFKKKIKSSKLSNNVTQTQSKKQQWFDSECEDQQNMFYSSLHDYRRKKSELNRQSMVENRSAYKKLLRKKRYQYDKNQTQKLEEARFKNTKEY